MTEDLFNLLFPKENKLLQAVCEKDNAAVERLIKQGEDIEVRDTYLYTALHFAAERNYKQIAETLIRLGADVNTLDKFKRTPLHLASLYDNYGIARILVKNHAYVNIQDDKGHTPLMLAIVGPILRKNKIVRLLLKNGADINIKDNNGSTALDLAKYYKQQGAIHRLLSKK